jgi:hypothetical protein
MEEAFVLWEYGMKVIGHNDPISYGKRVSKLKKNKFIFDF